MEVIIRDEFFRGEAGIVGLLVQQPEEKQKLFEQFIHQYGSQLGKQFVVSAAGLDLAPDETVLQNMRYRLQQAESKIDWLAQIETMLLLGGFAKSHNQKLIRDCSAFEQQVLRLVYAMLTEPEVVVIADFFILGEQENKQLKQMLIQFQNAYGTNFAIVLENPQYAVWVDKLYIWHNYSTLLVKIGEWGERHAKFLEKN